MENFVEHNDKFVPIKTLLNGLGVYQTVDKSYIVLAFFEENNCPKKYYASAATLEDIVEKAKKHKHNKSFTGKVYHLIKENAIPVSYKSMMDIKDWNN